MNSVSQPAAQEPAQDTAPDRIRIDCYDGKYTVIQSHDGGTRALRHGEEWRDCTGDGLILGLAMDLDEARKTVEQLHAKMTCCCGDDANHSPWSGHSPVSMYDHALDQANEEIARLRSPNRNALIDTLWNELCPGIRQSDIDREYYGRAVDKILVRIAAK